MISSSLPRVSDEPEGRASGALMPLVLVIDDERPMRRYLRTVLQEQHLRVIEAADGAEGLAQAAFAPRSTPPTS